MPTPPPHLDPATLTWAAATVLEHRPPMGAIVALIRAGAEDPVPHGRVVACPEPECVAYAGEICALRTGEQLWRSHPARRAAAAELRP